MSAEIPIKYGAFFFFKHSTAMVKMKSKAKCQILKGFMHGIEFLLQDSGITDPSIKEGITPI